MSSSRINVTNVKAYQQDVCPSGKRSYGHRVAHEVAKRALHRETRRERTRLRVYACGLCRLWHLTSAD